MQQSLPVCVMLLSLLQLSPFACGADTALLENAINGTTLALLRVDTENLELSPKLYELSQPDAAGELAALVQAAIEPVERLKGLMNGEQAYLAFDLPYSPHAQLRLLASTNVPESKLRSLAQIFWSKSIGEVSRSSGWRILHLATSADGSSPPALSADLTAAQLPAWESAMQATSDFPVQIVVVYPEYVRATVAELNADLPALLGGGSAKTLISDVEWFSLGLDPHAAKLRLIVQTASPETAETLATQIPRLLGGVLQEDKLDEPTLATLKSWVGLLKPTVDQSRVLLSLEDPQQADSLLQIGLAAFAAAYQPIAVTQTSDNLKQLILAMHNYEASKKTFPTYHDLAQSKNLSWRVHILPFIDQAELYQEFHLNEPWDSPHNIRLIDRMPEVFKPVIPLGSREKVQPFRTCYVAPVGPQTVFGQNTKVSFQQVTDGTSNTVVCVELRPEDAIPWTSPEEYPYDPARPAAKLRSINGRVSVALMDGSVRRVRFDEPVAVWKALFTRNGGEVFSLE